ASTSRARLAPSRPPATTLRQPAALVRNGVHRTDTNRTSVTDANMNVTTFEYDLANRLTLETTPIGTTTSFEYDLAGNRVAKVDGEGQRTEYTYDDARRLTDVLYDDATTAHFEYDARGNRTHESNADSTRNMTYDALGRLSTVEDVESGRTIEYGYDPAGQRTSMRVEPDGEVTTYAWDARGLLQRMTDPEGEDYRFAYDAAGRRTVATYPNGMTLAQTYDAASRILSMVYTRPGGEVIESFSYAYDSRGNRTHKVFADGGAESYGYDDLSRLTSATYPSGRSVTYEYDAVGNRMTMQERAGTPSSCPGDVDCDGHPDAFDNCPDVHNAEQADSDAEDPGITEALAFYRFEETTGTTAEDSADDHDATLQNGAAHLAEGRLGHALRFDGVDDFATSSVPLDGEAEASLEAWMRTSTTAASDGYVASVRKSSGGNGFDVGSWGRS
ncbi:MAG: hypothetical protein L0206_11400, partial [Actinobacteria bacterium]|nr:hypothetical protein [Actinomycetota bacterium]